MRKWMVLGLLLGITLTGCSSLGSSEDNGLYCFYSTSLGDYCADSEGDFDNIFIVIDDEEVPLRELVELDRFTSRYASIDEISFYERNYDVIYTGQTLKTKTIRYINIEYDYEYEYEYEDVIIQFEIVKFEETKIDENANEMISLVFEDTTFCMTTYDNYFQYGVKYDNGVISNIHDLAFLLDTPNISELGILGFDCEIRTITIEDTLYTYRYEDDTIAVLIKEQTSNIVMPAVDFYNDDGGSYCMLANIYSETNFILKDGQLFGIQDALDNDIIDGEDLLRFNIPRCPMGLSRGYRFYVYDDELCVGAEECTTPEYSEYYGTLKGYQLFIAYKNAEDYSLYTQYTKIKEDEYIYKLPDKNLVGYLTIMNEDEYISINSALDLSLISIEDILESGWLGVVSYGYYDK